MIDWRELEVMGVDKCREFFYQQVYVADYQYGYKSDGNLLIPGELSENGGNGGDEAHINEDGVLKNPGRGVNIPSLWNPREKKQSVRLINNPPSPEMNARGTAKAVQRAQEAAAARAGMPINNGSSATGTGTGTAGSGEEGSTPGGRLRRPKMNGGKNGSGRDLPFEARINYVKELATRITQSLVSDVVKTLAGPGGQAAGVEGAGEGGFYNGTELVDAPVNPVVHDQLDRDAAALAAEHERAQAELLNVMHHHTGMVEKTSNKGSESGTPTGSRSNSKDTENNNKASISSDDTVDIYAGAIAQELTNIPTSEGREKRAAFLTALLALPKPVSHETLVQLGKLYDVNVPSAEAWSATGTGVKDMAERIRSAGSDEQKLFEL